IPTPAAPQPLRPRRRGRSAAPRPGRAAPPPPRARETRSARRRGASCCDREVLARDRGAVGRRGRRGVLELLLGTEEAVEHGLAQVLVEDEGERGSDDPDEQDLPPGALLLRAATQPVGRLAQRFSGLAKLAVDLLVVDQRLRGLLLLLDPLVRVAAGS